MSKGIKISRHNVGCRHKETSEQNNEQTPEILPDILEDENCCSEKECDMPVEDWADE